MIYLYRLIFFCCLLLAASSLILPSTSGIPIERRLSMRPNDWTLTFNTPDRQLMGASEERAKNLLLKFARESNTASNQPLAWLTSTFLTAALFSFVGWRRELHFEKRTNGRADKPI